jgi:mannonate dehydratase
MKPGLGIPGPILTRETLQFARQAGATHVVAHFVAGALNEDPAGWLHGGIRRSIAGDPRYSYDSLASLRQIAHEEGVEIEAVENFAPADWYDVLLDGPRRAEQISYLQSVIRNVGRAGIRTFGYNFSLAGVWGRTMQPVARGRAMASDFSEPEEPDIPKGMVWNQIYDLELYERSVRAGEFLEPVSSEQLWDRFARFLADLVPVAEEAGVVLALHPDDPPAATLRNTPRLVHRGELYQRVLDLQPSASNAMEFCVGTLSEMPDQDIYEVVERFAATGKVRYVHLRNVKGRVPDYQETFVDDGYVDMQRVLEILARHGFDGVVIPDHTPQMSCLAPWHAGMAYALGWIRASMRSLGVLET